ncbi:uncharacterized protein TNCV_921061 [Trichonephila clavipes]|nr:uncharacterized protein TNCV_921061 [Trichonephila clavipes]
MNSTESAKSTSGKRPKKRKFTGNMHTRCKAVHSVDESLNNSASGKKIRLQDVDSSFIEHDDCFDGYRVFDKTIMFTNIQNFTSCKQCGGDIKLSEKCVREVAEASMQSAALEEVTVTNSSDIIISGDGTWKIRGYSSRVAVRGLLATDHVILNHGQVTWTTPELAPPLLTTTPHQREDVSALDRFNVHRCPTRRVFSGTELELVTKPPTIRCLPLGYRGHRYLGEGSRSREVV